MTRTRLAAFVLSTGLLLITGIAPVVATAATFNLSTPYPSVTIQPGNTVTFDLDVAVPSPERVDLAVSGTPSGWTADVRGGGNIVNSVYAGGSTAAALQLSVTVPQAATAGSSTIDRHGHRRQRQPAPADRRECARRRAAERSP